MSAARARATQVVACVLLVAWWCAGASSLSGASGCAGPRAASPSSAPAEIGFASALDPHAPVVLVLRPEALRRDEVFGPLVSALSRLAAARGVSGARELEAFESAEEVVVSVDAGQGAGGPGSLFAPDSGLVALRGVRADLVPERLLDGDGKLLFRSGRARASVTEHEGYAADPLSLFVLPRRTWVVAFGGAVTRARTAFLDGRARAAPTTDPEALLELRLDGPTLVARVPRLERGDLALGRRLDEARLTLRPGRGGLVLTLTYADDDAAAWAENALTRVVRAFSRRLEGALAWLGNATVVREARAVRVRVAVPVRVVEALKAIDARELLELVDPPAPRGDAGR